MSNKRSRRVDCRHLEAIENFGSEPRAIRGEIPYTRTIATETELAIALQAVHHGSLTPLRLILPLIPRP